MIVKLIGEKSLSSTNNIPQMSGGPVSCEYANCDYTASRPDLLRRHITVEHLGIEKVSV